MNEIAFDQIFILFLQCLIVATLLLSMFKLRSIFGLGPLFTTLGVFQFIQVFLSSSLYFQVAPNIYISPGSIVFSGTLFAILLIYIREDALEARKVIYAILAANLVLSIMQIVISWGIDKEGVLNIYNLPHEFFTQQTKVIIIGTILFFIDVFIGIFILEKISKHISSLFLRLFLSMTLVLSIDSILFTISVYTESNQILSNFIPNLISKISSVAVYTVLFTFYLTFLDKKKVKNESKADSFKDIFYKLTFRQKFEKVLKEKEIQEKELINAEIESKAVLNAIDDLVFVFDSSNRFTAYYTKETNLYLTPDKFLGKKLSEVMPSHINYLFEEAILKLKNNNIAGFDYSLKMANGVEKWYSIKFSPIFFNKAYKGAVAVSRDITDKKLIEKELYESEEKFRTIYNNSPDMMVSVSPNNGIILNCNDTLLINTGYKREEVVGHPIFKMYHNDCMNDVKKAFQKFVETGVVTNEKLTLQRKDGSIIDVILDVKSVKNNNGKIRYSISSWRDITEHRIIENELKEYRENLEKLVKERTLELEVKNLKLEELNKVFVGRELRMAKLKEEIEILKSEVKNKN